MNKKALYKIGDRVRVKNSQTDLIAQILSIINSPDEHYYAVRYINDSSKDKQFDCLKESDFESLSK